MQRSPIPGNLSTTTYNRPSGTLISPNQGQNVTRLAGYSQGLSSPLISPAPISSTSATIVNTLPGTSTQPIENIQREEIKSHFTTPEGIYKKMTVATYSRPNKTVIVNTGTNTIPNCPVRVSFVKLPSAPEFENGDNKNDNRSFCSEKICFNIGRELFVYDYVGIHGTPNLSFQIDKRIYKGTFPTCHDFNRYAVTHDSVQLIIGFSAGQVQLIDPLKKEYIPSKLFNEERNIEKTSVTCAKWIPGHEHCFMVSHSSGNIYVYNELYQCYDDQPIYQIYKQDEGYTIYTIKSKIQRNPLTKIQIGTTFSSSNINEFEFYQSETSLYLAIVSQDGYLRIFDYNKMELIGLMKSYFGGLTCLSWSPDGKLIATGGEDDLLTIYSVIEKRVICRGQGHKSWISRVSFDPYITGLSATTSTMSLEDVVDDNNEGNNGANVVITTACVNKYGCEEPTQINGIIEYNNQQTPTVNVFASTTNGINNTYLIGQHENELNLKKNASISTNSVNYTGIDMAHSSVFNGYRVGTVGHDTQLLLWDIGDDIISNPPNKRIHRPNIINVGLSSDKSDFNQMTTSTSSDGGDSTRATSSDMPSTSSSSTKSRLKKFHKRGFSFGNRLSRAVGISSHHQNGITNGCANNKSLNTVFGSQICPKMNEVPIIEPLLNKKIAHERLTSLFFKEDCIITGCQEGFICTWARPGRAKKNSIGSARTATSMTGAVDSYAHGPIHV